MPSSLDRYPVSYIVAHKDGTATIGEIVGKDEKGKRIIRRKVVPENEVNDYAKYLIREEKEQLKNERENGRKILDMDITSTEIRHYGKNQHS